MRRDTILLLEGLKQWELPTPGEEALIKLETYSQMLIEKNKEMNLTAVDDEELIMTRHFLESISIIKTQIKNGSKVIDVGCGAGFPGLPLKMYCEGIGLHIELTLLDSTAKKIDFLRVVCEKTNTAAEFVPQRAEEAIADRREQYDLVLSRAVAKMNILCELCLPFVNRGGRFIAIKSDKSNDEIKEAVNAVKLLGGIYANDMYLDIKSTEMRLRLVTVNKISQTPPKFPRKFSHIKAKPL